MPEIILNKGEKLTISMDDSEEVFEVKYGEPVTIKLMAGFELRPNDIDSDGKIIFESEYRG